MFHPLRLACTWCYYLAIVSRHRWFHWMPLPLAVGNQMELLKLVFCFSLRIFLSVLSSYRVETGRLNCRYSWCEWMCGRASWPLEISAIVTIWVKERRIFFIFARISSFTYVKEMHSQEFASFMRTFNIIPCALHVNAHALTQRHKHKHTRTSPHSLIFCSNAIIN